MGRDDAETRVESCNSSAYTLMERPQDSFPLNSKVSVKSLDTFTTITYSTSPSLILLFSWTGAQPRHVSKYIKGYSTLFPDTPLFVIETSLKDLAIRSSQEKQQMLQPTLDTVLNSYSTSGILVHCFSDGGSNKAVEFAEAYHTRTGHKLPCHALCLDSTPGYPRYLNYASAFQKSLPQNIIVRYFGLVFGLLVLAILWFAYCTLIGFEKNVICETRRRLEDERFWSPRTTPRGYFYSKRDNMIYWKDVEEHGVEAREKGVQTTLVRFTESGHCGHVLEDEGRYWGGVREVWEMRDLEIGFAC
jgi:hypothetical protein